MALKDLLVHVDNSKACATRVDAAIRLAQSYDAHMTGLYVIPALYLPGYAEAQLPAEVIEAQSRSIMKEVAEAEEMFRSAIEKAGVSGEWRSVEGILVDKLSLHARYSDLVVVGQGEQDDPMSISEGLAGRLVLAAGRPVLVIPYIGARPTIGDRVMIAWNASREAVRALHDALPLLERAKSVNVLSVNPPQGTVSGGDIPSTDICLHLGRHGVRAEANQIEAHDIKVGDMLLSRAADRGVDLIVMGAYGHSRLREIVLGGATRQILANMTVPVLMSH